MGQAVPQPRDLSEKEYKGTEVQEDMSNSPFAAKLEIVAESEEKAETAEETREEVKGAVEKTDTQEADQEENIPEALMNMILSTKNTKKLRAIAEELCEGPESQLKLIQTDKKKFHKWKVEAKDATNELAVKFAKAINKHKKKLDNDYFNKQRDNERAKKAKEMMAKNVARIESAKDIHELEKFAYQFSVPFEKKGKTIRKALIVKVNTGIADEDKYAWKVEGIPGKKGSDKLAEAIMKKHKEFKDKATAKALKKVVKKFGKKK